MGIGDDAAWTRAKGNLLLTSDLLIDKVHFDRRWASFYGLGYKTLAVNLSDVAAMGGTPEYLLLSLGLPVDFKVKDIEEFYRGIGQLASQTGVSLVGGDTCASKCFFTSAFLVGHAPYGPVKRSGARVGDDLYVTGTLGDSFLGLNLLKKRKRIGTSKEVAYLTSRHLFPQARLKAGSILAKEKLAKAMIDISDGLVQDLGHLCKSSGTGAEIWQEAIPLSPPYRRLAGVNRAHYSLAGGEDYELLFSVRARDHKRLKKIQNRLGVPITHIGKCLPARHGITVTTSQGTSLSLSQMGYDHFKGLPLRRAPLNSRSIKA